MKRKITVVGAGNVGASLVQLITASGLADVMMFDVVDGLAEGKALDMAEACPLWGSSASVRGTTHYDETRDSDIVVITAGLARKPGMSRDDLLHANAKIVKDVALSTAKFSPDAIFIIVTNPMDVMAQLAFKSAQLSQHRVIGMGGVLDATRFRTFVAWEAGVSVRDVEALVMGGHGDQMVPMPKYTTVKGIPVTELFSPERIAELIRRTQNGGAEIVALLKHGSAFYAPAAATFEMVRSIILDEKRMLPCSVYLTGQYGISDIFFGAPTVLGKDGVERIVEISLTQDEVRLLEASAEATRKLISSLEGN